MLKDNLLDLSTNVEIAMKEWLISLGILLVLIFVVKKIYDKRANTVSNRKMFSNNFFPFGLAIFLIITSIKASLALSLGLVGALSIIRFRTAIKEPEQIVYLLLIIAMSISLAAQQTVPAIVTFAVFVPWAFSTKNKAELLKNDLIQLSVSGDNKDMLEQLMAVVKATPSVNGITKITQADKNIELILSIENMKEENFISLKKEIEKVENCDIIGISYISSFTV